MSRQIPVQGGARPLAFGASIAAAAAVAVVIGLLLPWSEQGGGEAVYILRGYEPAVPVVSAWKVFSGIDVASAVVAAFALLAAAGMLRGARHATVVLVTCAGALLALAAFVAELLVADVPAVRESAGPWTCLAGAALVAAGAGLTAPRGPAPKLPWSGRMLFVPAAAGPLLALWRIDGLSTWETLELYDVAGAIASGSLLVVVALADVDRRAAWPAISLAGYAAFAAALVPIEALAVGNTLATPYVLQIAVVLPAALAGIVLSARAVSSGVAQSDDG